MQWTKLVPSRFRPALRPLYQALAARWPRTRAHLHRYWSDPWDGINRPEEYLSGTPRSEFLVSLVRQFGPAHARVLELGCNVGRNLHHLQQSGYSDLTGVEINRGALDLLARHYPDVAATARLIHAPIEAAVTQFADDEFDAVFTMAVLEHLHPRSKDVFTHMARIAPLVITIEDERGKSWRHFPRNYRRVFERLGLRQQAEQSCAQVPGLGPKFVARVFARSCR